MSASNTALREGSLPEMISPYIRELIEKTGGVKGPIGLQFISQPEFEKQYQDTDATDPLNEEEHEAAPGVIYKYKGSVSSEGKVEYYGRALWTISRYCATYCRFCFRGRMVGLPAHKSLTSGETLLKRPYLTDDDISSVMSFLHQHPEINEVVLSGGDPLIVPPKYFDTVITNLVTLQSTDKLDIIRIHTRAPITNPESIKEWHFNTIKKIKNPYLVLHINHPEEITDQVISLVSRFRKECDAIILSQTVFLKGINDSVDTLQDLFNKMVKHGIRPYYLHNNDPVYWAKHFTVPQEEAITIWHRLRPRLSGLAASAKYVIDTPYGHGKVPYPENGWKVDLSSFTDFHNVRHDLL